MTHRLRVAGWALDGALAAVGDDPAPSMDTSLAVMIAKREIALAAIEVCDLAMEIGGRAAFDRGSPIERAYRDVRAASSIRSTPSSPWSTPVVWRSACRPSVRRTGDCDALPRHRRRRRRRPRCGRGNGDARWPGRSRRRRRRPDPAGSDTLSTHALMRGAVIQLPSLGLLDRIRAAGTPAVRAPRSTSPAGRPSSTSVQGTASRR